MLIFSKCKNKIKQSIFFNLEPKLRLKKKYKKFKPFDNKKLIRKHNFLKKRLKYSSKQNNINKLKTSLLKKIYFKKHKPLYKTYKNYITFVTIFLN